MRGHEREPDSQPGEGNRGVAPALAGLVSRRYGRFWGSWDSGGPGPGRCTGSGRDLGPALGPGHLGQGQRLQLGGQLPQPPGVV
jgi:hypothetical protein